MAQRAAVHAKLRRLEADRGQETPRRDFLEPVIASAWVAQEPGSFAEIKTLNRGIEKLMWRLAKTGRVDLAENASSPTNEGPHTSVVLHWENDLADADLHVIDSGGAHAFKTQAERLTPVVSLRTYLRGMDPSCSSPWAGR